MDLVVIVADVIMGDNVVCSVTVGMCDAIFVVASDFKSTKCPNGIHTPL